MVSTDERAQMSAAEIDNLPDSDFAYIEPGGTKDAGGKTVPRSKRHFPINDAAHVRNALTRLSQSPFGELAKGKVIAAAKKFGINVGANVDMMPSERRQFFRPVAEIEARQDANGQWRIGGYASTFNQPYSVRDRFGEFNETILPGAWDRTLHERGHKIQILESHAGTPLGSTKANNLRLYTDTYGLGYEWLPNARRSRSVDIAEGIADGSVDATSVGMRIPEGGDAWDGDNRSISEASLLEISIVGRGANPNATAAMREEELLAEVRRLEELTHRYDLNEARRALESRAPRTTVPVTEELAQLWQLRK